MEGGLEVRAKRQLHQLAYPRGSRFIVVPCTPSWSCYLKNLEKERERTGLKLWDLARWLRAVSLAIVVDSVSNENGSTGSIAPTTSATQMVDFDVATGLDRKQNLDGGRIKDSTDHSLERYATSVLGDSLLG